jgi:DNA adenine methylase
VSIYCGDYQDALSSIEEGWFTYFDPPYRPLTQTSFTTYGAMDWSDDTQQIRLANFAKGLHEKGLKFMISNSDPTSVDETDLFFPEQFPFPTYRILSIKAIRAINSNGNDRGVVGEILITNYTLEEES